MRDFHRQAIVNWPLVDEAELKRHSVFQAGDPSPYADARAARSVLTGVPEHLFDPCFIIYTTLLWGFPKIGVPPNRPF